MSSYPLIIILVFCALTSIAQEDLIRGRVVDSETSLPLEGATISLDGSSSGTVTDDQGFFVLRNIDVENKNLLLISYVGYQTLYLATEVLDPRQLLIQLEPRDEVLGEIYVEDERPGSLSTQAEISSVAITSDLLTAIPSITGQPDLIRTIQNLPGVKTTADFVSGFGVRGGRNDQNLIILDGVPIYNPWHLFGVFSAFAPGSIRQAEFSKGIFPANYGSRLSSVLDITSTDGTGKPEGSVSLNPISLSANYSGKLAQRLSVGVTVRRTFLDPFLGDLTNDQLVIGEGDAESAVSVGYYFYDVNAKLHYSLNDNHQIVAGSFRSRDKLDSRVDSRLTEKNQEIVDQLDYSWRNRTHYVTLNSKWRPNLTSRLQLWSYSFGIDNIKDFQKTFSKQVGQLSRSAYRTDQVVSIEEREKKLLQSITDMGIQQDFSLLLSDNARLSFGFQAIRHQFEDRINTIIQEFGFEITNENLLNPPELNNKIYFSSQAIFDEVTANEMALYLDGDLNAGRFNFFPGIRMQYYSESSGPDWLPRLNISYQLNHLWKATAGAGYFVQYLQSVGLNFLVVPAERLFWANDDLAPARSVNYNAGVKRILPEVGFVSIEGYYKKMDGILNFDAAEQARGLEDEFFPIFSRDAVSGTGRAYGLELFARKTKGNLSGWLGYTLGWNWNLFSQLNSGREFPDRSDQRHALKVFLSYDFLSHWSVSGVFNFATGQPITIAQGTYLKKQDPLEIGAGSFPAGEVFSGVNNYRLPAYHRLDLSLTWSNGKFLGKALSISLNLVNAYNRRNVLSAGQDIMVNRSAAGLEVASDLIYSQQLPFLPMINFKWNYLRPHEK